MERMVTFELGGKPYKLVFTSGIELDILDEYELQTIFDIFQITGSKRIKAILDLIRRMNEKAGGPKLALKDDVPPAEMMILQEALLRAITLGYLREVAPGEVDEGLMELEKKKAGQQGRTSWFSRVFGSIFQKKTHTTRHQA